MKIAILSDIHDNLDALARALDAAKGCEALICCGDLNSPFVVKALGSGFSGPQHIVFGNNDADRFRITTIARDFSHINLHGEYVELELGGLSFSVNHFDNIGRALAAGGQFDVVCFGHNHRHEVAQNSFTTLINPGEIYGRLSGESTFVIFETATREASLITLPK